MGEKTEKQRVGEIGENIACRFMAGKGYRIVARHFLVRAGEIDIICEKRGILYFVEVKTVSREMLGSNSRDDYRPEDNLHENKIQRMDRAIQIYLEKYDVKEDWEIIGVMVSLDLSRKTASVRLLTDFAW
jgi:putative endonuclease